MWLKELNLFSNVTQRIEPLFEYDSENLNFCQINTTQSQRIELSFFQYDSTNWTLFFLHVIHVFKWFKDFFLEKFLKELIFHMTQRMVPDAKTWNLCFWNLIQRIGPFFFWWLADLKLFFQKLWRKELNLFFQKVWLKELNSKNFFFFWFAAKNWVFFLCKFWLELSHFFLNRTQRIELFYMTYRIEPLLFSLIWFEELNFVSKKETQKIEIFFVDKWLTELNSL